MSVLGSDAGIASARWLSTQAHPAVAVAAVAIVHLQQSADCGVRWGAGYSCQAWANYGMDYGMMVCGMVDAQVDAAVETVAIAHSQRSAGCRTGTGYKHQAWATVDHSMDHGTKECGIVDAQV